MKYEIVKYEQSGADIKMPISNDGYSLCPVCGEQARNKTFRPYDNLGHPSYSICGCGIEFGFECSPESTQRDWDNYREKWLSEKLEYGNSQKMPKSKKIEQLKAIGIELKTNADTK